jgi:hypothetical protein
MKTIKFFYGFPALIVLVFILIHSCASNGTDGSVAKSDSTLFRVIPVVAWTCIKANHIVYTNVPDTMKSYVSKGYKAIISNTFGIQGQKGSSQGQPVTVLFNVLPQGYWQCTGANMDNATPRFTTSFDQALTWIKKENSSCTYVAAHDSLH